MCVTSPCATAGPHAHDNVHPCLRTLGRCLDSSAFRRKESAPASHICQALLCMDKNMAVLQPCGDPFHMEGRIRNKAGVRGMRITVDIKSSHASSLRPCARSNVASGGEFLARHMCDLEYGLCYMSAAYVKAFRMRSGIAMHLNSMRQSWDASEIAQQSSCRTAVQA